MSAVTASKPLHPPHAAALERRRQLLRSLRRVHVLLVVCLFGTLSLYFHLPGFSALPDLAKLGIVVGLVLGNVFRLRYESLLTQKSRALR